MIASNEPVTVTVKEEPTENPTELPSEQPTQQPAGQPSEQPNREKPRHGCCYTFLWILLIMWATSTTIDLLVALGKLSFGVSSGPPSQVEVAATPLPAEDLTNPPMAEEVCVANIPVCGGVEHVVTCQTCGEELRSYGNPFAGHECVIPAPEEERMVVMCKSCGQELPPNGKHKCSGLDFSDVTLPPA